MKHAEIGSPAIIAQCTPCGTGAIALLRLSGDNALTIADKISKLTNTKTISSQQTHTIHYGWIVDAHGNHIDQVLFFIMHAPHTFTGYNTVEITCHNNQFIIQNIFSAAIAAGARLAQEGEFSRQAVENKKIDIIQAEAINDLIHANTQHVLKQSLSQLQGSFTHYIFLLEQKLIKALAFSEASFEFIDEENMEFNHTIKEIVDEVLVTITKLKNSFDQQQQIRQGIRIAIIGSVNAGKSSLFNKLLQQNRAIVTEIAGTTRDAIEAGLYKDGNYWTLIDTAGLRETDNIIEQIGVTHSYKEAHKADIILLVFDGSRILTPAEQIVYQTLLDRYNSKIIIINNKADLPRHYNLVLNNRNVISTAYNNTDNALIESAIQKKINLLFSSIESPFLLNQRHYNALLSLEKKLHTLYPMLIKNPCYELISYHLNDALATLSELTGKTISEEAMDAVFREFCVGK